MISIIHPSRSRPHKSYSTISKWLRNATTNIELIISLDEDDPNLFEYKQVYKDHVNSLIVFPNKSSVEAVNVGAQHATGDILIVVSDDTDCPYHWDNQILNAVTGRQDFVLKVYDGIQKWICTMPIIDRIYYERFGYIYFPMYKHMFSDTEFTHIADVMRKIIWRNDILFQHMHYSVGKSHKDHISIKADSTINEGAQIYIDRFKNNFGLIGIDCWNLSPEGESNKEWLRNKLK